MGKARGRGGTSCDDTYNLLGCCGFIGAFLTLLLVPLSFTKIQFYEHGLLAQKSTSQVTKGPDAEVYPPGNHQIGPDYEFQTFATSLQTYEQVLAGVPTNADGTDGTGVNLVYLGVNFQYRLRPKEIGVLYDEWGNKFQKTLQEKASATIKNIALEYGADAFLIEREKISKALAENVSTALDSVHADVVALQLQRVQFEEKYYETKQTAAIQLETNEEENFRQSASLVRTQTVVDAAEVSNQAIEVAEAAVAKAELLIATAEYAARQTIENARNDGLVSLYETLGIYSESQKASLDYLLLLTTKAQGGASALSAYVDFDSANSFT